MTPRSDHAPVTGSHQIVAVCCAAMVLATASNFVLGTLAPFLVEDAIVSAEQIGLITATYYVTAIVLSPSGGRFAGHDDPRGCGGLQRAPHPLGARHPVTRSRTNVKETSA